MQFRFRYLEKDIKAAGSLEIGPRMLKPGKKLYLEIADEFPDLQSERESGYIQKFVSVSEFPIKGSVAFRIYHIAYNSRVILLTRKRYTDIGKIHNFLEDYVSIEDLTEMIVPLSEYPENWTGSTEDREARARATVINFLAYMAELGVLKASKESGKGGYHAVYTAGMGEVDFRKYILSMVIYSMMKDYPEETMSVLKQHR